VKYFQTAFEVAFDGLERRKRKLSRTSELIIFLYRLSILLSLPSQANASQDPVSIYLESQHNHIRGLMRKAYDEGVAKVDGEFLLETFPSRRRF